jgi:ElaB/YqjD/DUF883 family membrane-anchored ribosome-binding protein
MTNTNPRAVADAEIERTTASLIGKIHGLENQIETAKDRVVSAVDLRTHVRDQPWRSVAIAVAAGVVIGWLR